MADAVRTLVIANTADRLIVNFTNISDGTGESTVTKVDKSTFFAPPVGAAAPAEPVALDVEQIEYIIQGMASVRLLWDYATDVVIAALTGSGYKDYRAKEIGIPGYTADNDCLKDPVRNMNTGDILITTNGQVSGATYDITVWFKKRNS